MHLIFAFAAVAHAAHAAAGRNNGYICLIDVKVNRNKLEKVNLLALYSEILMVMKDFIMNDPLYIRISNDDPLPELLDLTPFKAIVIIEELVADYYQNRVSCWLVDQGCRFMLAWGMKCTDWDDSVDYANMEQYNYEEIPDEDFVMTTWHENQALAEVFEFEKFSIFEQIIKKSDESGRKISEESIPYKKTIFLHIGSEDKECEFLKLYERQGQDI